MKIVGIKALKDRLSEYVRAARALGEGWLEPRHLRAAEPPPRHPVATFAELMSELEGDREDR